MGVCYTESAVYQHKFSVDLEQRDGVLFIGERRCGQTAICNRILSNQYLVKHNDKHLCNQLIQKDNTMNIVDIAGLRTESMIEQSIQYLKQYKTIVITFSLVNLDLEQLDNRLRFVQRVNKSANIIIVGTKLDLYQNDFKELCELQNEFEVILVSAKTGEGIEKLKEICGIAEQHTRENSTF
ncbi:Rab13 [Hexamita inflata]|uniref:Rab13 n=1 Tax=Hexamita inflata TaxID=28002 RepID=A0AA86UPJ9_9EUKA|nr:Rab13 [Hexamita inflata]CAI9959667.1 Rab13 [Hexamita inflata]